LYLRTIESPNPTFRNSGVVGAENLESIARLHPPKSSFGSARSDYFVVIVDEPGTGVIAQAGAASCSDGVFGSKLKRLKAWVLYSAVAPPGSNEPCKGIEVWMESFGNSESHYFLPLRRMPPNP